jgi:hypothetical protein
MPGDVVSFQVAQGHVGEHPVDGIADGHVRSALVDEHPAQGVERIVHRISDQNTVLFRFEVQFVPAATDKLQLVPPAEVSTVAANEQCRETQLAGKRADGIAFCRVDPLGAEIDAIDSPTATSDTIAGLQDGDLVTKLREGTRGCQSGNARAEHQHALDLMQSG